MPSRSQRRDHCPDCVFFRPLCICAATAEVRARLPGLRTRVVVLMHHRERKIPTNTARLAAAALPECEIRLRGLPGRPLETEGLNDPGRQPLLLFPCPEAVELTPEFVAGLDARPITLIVPDGSWRQASKVSAREPGLKGIPRVALPPGPPSTYRLRREPDERFVCTFEAIARALEALEGEARGSEVRSLLEDLFDLRVERTLWSSGRLPASECRHPIPQAAWDAFREAGERGAERSLALKLERRRLREEGRKREAGHG